MNMAQKNSLWTALKSLSWTKLRSAFRFSLHPAPDAPTYAFYPTNYRPMIKSQYTPENYPTKELQDVSSIYYWKHASGKRGPPVPRKPDVLVAKEKEPAPVGPIRADGPDDLLTRPMCRPPVETKKWTEVPKELWT
jgi:hypothetical protein